MAQLAIPRAERSGAHRVVDVEVGDLRQAIAALAGVATLARSTGVGPRALRDLLPGLRASCLSLPATVTRALLPACDVVALATGLHDDAQQAVDALVASTRAAACDVIAAVDGADKSLGARSRIALQGACDRAVADLLRVRHATEVLQRASVGEPVAVALDDLFSELATVELPVPGAVSVQLSFVGDVTATVAVHPRVGMAVLLGALSSAHGLSPVAPPSAFVSAFVATVSTGETCVTVELTRAHAPFAVSATAATGDLRVLLAPPSPYDELVLRLAAATVAASVRVQGTAVQVDLLRA